MEVAAPGVPVMIIKISDATILVNKENMIRESAMFAEFFKVNAKEEKITWINIKEELNLAALKVVLECINLENLTTIEACTDMDFLGLVLEVTLHFQMKRLCDAVLERMTQVGQGIANDKAPSNTNDGKAYSEDIVDYINAGRLKSAPPQDSSGLLSRKMILLVLLICILYPMLF